jgi:hypothetical protein
MDISNDYWIAHWIKLLAAEWHIGYSYWLNDRTMNIANYYRIAQ